MERIRTVDRINKFIEYLIGEKRISSIADFDKMCGFYYGFTANQKKGKGFMDGESMAAISETFPELNMDWVITGRGNMLMDNIKSTYYKEAYEAALNQIAALNKIIAEENKKRAPKK